MSRDLLDDRSSHLRDVIEPRARANGNENSRAAARRARAWAPTHRERILGVMFKPMTIYKVAQLTGLDHVAVARRMSELRDAGEVKDTGLSEKSPHGDSCTLWEKVLQV